MIATFAAWAKRASKWLAIVGAIGLALTLLLPLAWKSAVKSVPSVDGGDWYENHFGDWYTVATDSSCKVEFGPDQGWCKVATLQPGTYRIVPMYEKWVLQTDGPELSVPPEGLLVSALWGNSPDFAKQFMRGAPGGERGRLGALVGRVGSFQPFVVTLNGHEWTEFTVKGAEAPLKLNVSLLPRADDYKAVGDNVLAVRIERRGKPGS